MNFYEQKNDKIIALCNKIVDNDGNNISAYHFIKNNINEGVASCLLIRSMFKKFNILEYKKSNGKKVCVDGTHNKYLLINKNIVYYVSRDCVYFDTQKYMTVYLTSVVEGFYKYDENGIRKFIPSAIIDIKSNGENDDFSAKISQINTNHEITYKTDDGEIKKYLWNGFTVTNMHKFNNTIVLENYMKYSPIIDDKVKALTLIVNKNIKE